jgi:hypothetical protein
MKQLAIILVLLVSVVSAQVGGNAHPLTNDDVAKLLQQQIAPAVIVKVIRASTVNFDTSPEALLKLKQAGAPQAVLDAMVVAKVAQQGGVPATVVAPSILPPATVVHEPPLEGIVAPQIEGVTRASKSAGACHPDLASCPANGCSDPTSAADHAAFNEAKRNIPAAGTKPVLLDIANDFPALQQAAEEKVGSGGDIPAASRAELADLDTSGGKVGEGSLVRVFGFLTSKPDGLGPHPNTGESVNCNLKGEPNNDIHIPLVDQPGQSEYEGIVVEMIPQGRASKSGWDSKTLIAVAKKGLEVMVEGQLFYDNQHKVNAEQDDPLKGQPARMSLWEVHPITSFLVCPKTTGCSHTSKTEWVQLSKFKVQGHAHH